MQSQSNKKKTNRLKSKRISYSKRVKSAKCRVNRNITSQKSPEKLKM